MKQTKRQRAIIIADTIQRSVSGWQIPMMEIGNVSSAGKTAAEPFSDVSSDAAKAAIIAAVRAKLKEVATPA